MAATDRDKLRLQGVHPTLVTAILAILDELPMFVVMGVRTAEQQRQLYLQGRSLPGKIVTKCDGYFHKSNHQPHDDGFGHAVDCAWLGTTPFGDTMPWADYGAKVRAAGLVWGGDWTLQVEHIVDRPHVELP